MFHSLLLLYFSSISSMKEFFFNTSLFRSRTISLKTTDFELLTQKSTLKDVLGGVVTHSCSSYFFLWTED